MNSDPDTITTIRLPVLLEVLAGLLILPGLLVMLLLLGAAMAPVAVVGLPFMLPAFFPMARREMEMERELQTGQGLQPAGAH